MNVIPTALPGLLILEPKVFGDARGFFIVTGDKDGNIQRCIHGRHG